MALPGLNYRQNDFSGGQLTESAVRRDDTKLYRRGLRNALNTRSLNTGPVENRFGRKARFADTGRTEEVRISDALRFTITFGEGTATIRDGNDAVVFMQTGFPWTIGTLDEIIMAVAGRDVVCTYGNNRPWVFKYELSQTLIAPGEGSAIGDFTLNGGLAAAFDDVTNQARDDSAKKNSATAGYVGKDFSALPRRIGLAIVWGSNNVGYVDNINPTVTLKLRGKNGSAPASNTDGTLLATVSFTDTSNESGNPRLLASSDLVTEWDYVFIDASHNGAANPCLVSEIRFYQPASVGGWSASEFAFSVTPAGVTRQPFYRYAAAGVTLQPSARTGVTVNFTFSEPVLQAAHAGVEFRWANRRIRIDTVTNAILGVGTVIEELPPTIRFTVDSSADFRVGDVVLGQSSNAEGVVMNVPDTTHLDCLMLKRFAGFASGETINGPTSSATVSAVGAEQTPPPATTVWDEAAMSDVRGWPASCFYDRGRLGFCDFPNIQSGITESAIGSPYDLAIGTNADDGFFETVPKAIRVRHVIGGSDQFVLTTGGAYYIPISASNPLGPGSVEFILIDDSGCSGVRPVQMKQGVIFGTVSGKSLMGILPTGQQKTPYRVAEVSQFHSDLIASPLALAVTTTGAASPEQYLWCMNADGSLAVGRFDQSNEWIGFVPHTSFADLTWVSAYEASLWFNLNYDLGGSDQGMAENIDDSAYLDGKVVLNDPLAALAGDPGDGPLWFYAGLTVTLMKGATVLGTRAVDSSGDIVTEAGDDFSDAAIVVGLPWPTPTVTPFLANIDEGDPKGQRTRRRRIKQALATVQDTSEFILMNRTFARTPAGASEVQLFSDTYKARQTGRSYDPSFSFEKPVPGPFRIIDLAGEVTV